MRDLAKILWVGLIGLSVSGCKMDIASLKEIPIASSRSASTLTLAGGAVIVAGPQGYCVDRSSVSESDAGAFVLLANCRGLKKRPLAEDDPAKAVLTASISALTATPLDPDVLEAFFGSEAGRAALARSGIAEAVTVLDIFAEGSSFVIHAKDTSPNPLGPLGSEYWRVLTKIDGRIVTMTATPFRSIPMRSETLRRQVLEFASTMTKANEGLPQTIVSQ